MSGDGIKQEKIGSVTLDLTYYSGQDFYSDGDIEDEMLDIAMNNPVERFPEIIEEKKSWPVFYHFSPLRSNIIDWIPFKSTDKILEIGAGCGAITGALAKRTGSVTCVDLSKKRSMVNAYRNREYDNITIMVGNFKDIEPYLDTDYDYVLLVGVFEYGQAYIGGSTPYEDFMQICNRHRKLDGRLIIAIENKFGLKYWAGCREDHLGTYFSGLEGYHTGGAARTFTRHGLERILEKVGIHEYAFYYPYPDYKFMTTIYSDRYLPKKGELCNNLRNFDRERVLLFDEKQVFDEIVDENEFPLFSNSYLLVVGGAPNVLYAKFSNDRAAEWAVRTLIVREAPGKLHVEKQPDTEAACGHLMNTKRAYDCLSSRYEGTKIAINKCRLIEEDVKKGLEFAFCSGKTLETLLDECLGRADVQGFKSLIDEYMHWAGYNEDAVEASNIDFIFPNILVDREGDMEKWHVIDYEWTFDKHIPARDIIFRAFYNYTLGGGTRKACEDLLMRDILGLTDTQLAAAVEQERSFQMKITGNHSSAENMRELIGNRAYALEGMLMYYNYADKKFVAQIYVDYGQGFSEANSVKLMDCYFAERYLRLAYDIPDDAVRIRIDPCSYMCAINIRELRVGDRLYTADVIETNGSWQECGTLVFDTEDPNLAIDVAGGRKLVADLEVMELPHALAAQLAGAAAKEDFVTKTKGFIKARMKGRQ
ncbi:MAG: methyltransferase domain-containing protein [Lachnospiraceae bacterium]|nr:methyltransferase domain-containing protein [Lachnospiraceae bacterium]